MANPKRRHSRSRRDKRRANWKLEPVNFSTCPQCGALVLPHTACSKCGFYNGKIAVIVKSKDSKKENISSDNTKEVSASE
jgi:large subunit ribosomal protein L32